MANIIAANHVAVLHPSSDAIGVGGSFGILTCFGTCLSFVLMNAYEGYDKDDAGWFSLLVGIHTVIIVSVVYGWITYLG